MRVATCAPTQTVVPDPLPVSMAIRTKPLNAAQRKLATGQHLYTTQKQVNEDEDGGQVSNINLYL